MGLQQKTNTSAKPYGGINDSIELTLDYEVFNNLTIKQASEIDDFFLDRDNILMDEENNYITCSIEHYKTDYGEIYSGDLEQIVNSWELEENALKREFEILNDSLVSDFYELNGEFIEYEHFEEFLDDLCIGIYHNRVEISSYRSSYTCCCFSYDYLTEAIDSYIQEIVEQKDVKFLGFDVGDEFYWCCLCENFGYPPDDVDNDDDGDDDGGGDQEENVPVPV